MPIRSRMTACLAAFCAMGLCALPLAACDPSVQDIRIAAQEFRFQPAEVRLHGPATFRLIVVNEGNEPHEFSSTLFSDPNVRLVNEAAGPPPFTGRGVIKLLPRQAVPLLLQAQAGAYFYRCMIPGHHGMQGTLIVE